MGVKTEAKLNDMQNYGKTDGSVKREYLAIENKCDKLKETYKHTKEEYNLAKKEMEYAREKLNNASFLSSFRARKQYRQAKKKFKYKKQQLVLDKMDYKSIVKQKRKSEKEIRSQYKAFNGYQTFFKKINEAQKMGLEIPKYILDEYKRQQQEYSNQMYLVDDKGNRYYMMQTNKSYRDDISKLIWEKKQNNIKDAVKDTIEHIKENVSNKDSERNR